MCINKTCLSYVKKKRKWEEKSESAVRELPKEEEEEEHSEYVKDREDGEKEKGEKMEDWPVKCPAFLFFFCPTQKSSSPSTTPITKNLKTFDFYSYIIISTQNKSEGETADKFVNGDHDVT